MDTRITTRVVGIAGAAAICLSGAWAAPAQATTDPEGTAMAASITCFLGQVGSPDPGCHGTHHARHAHHAQAAAALAWRVIVPRWAVF